MHGAVRRKDLSIPEDAFVVGMVGRMSPQKAPDVFIKMARQELSVTFLLWMFICMLLRKEKQNDERI